MREREIESEREREREREAEAVCLFTDSIVTLNCMTHPTANNIFAGNVSFF